MTIPDGAIGGGCYSGAPLPNVQAREALAILDETFNAENEYATRGEARLSRRERGALATAMSALSGLIAIYDGHGLAEVSGGSGADQCADLYNVLNALGLEVE